MYNRLLFDCPQLSLDVIFAAVSNQCPQRPPVRELFPPPQVAAEGLVEARKEAFFDIPKKRGTLGLMTLNFCSPKSTRRVYIAFILLCLVFSGTAFGKEKHSSGRSARSSKSKKATARSRSSRHGGQQVASRSSRRRGGRLSARDVR